MGARPGRAAWRRYRTTVLLELAVIGLLVLLVAVVWWVAGSVAADRAGGPRLTDWWGVLVVVLAILPPLVGLFVGADLAADDDRASSDCS